MPVYVPAPTSPLRHTIRRGSGIVGVPHADGFVRIDFEGGIYEQAEMRRYANRVLHAAGRARANYPTVARALVRADELVEVGVWNDDLGRVLPHPTADAVRALTEWLGGSSPAPDEFLATGAKRGRWEPF
jgi:hypothetical protein